MKPFKWMTLALCFAVSGSLMTACDDDDDDNKAPQEVSGPATYDGLSYFQNNLVVVDEDGNFVSRGAYGEILNEADTTVLSIAVSSADEAKKIFKSWLPDGAECIENGNRLIYSPKSENGQSQGTIYLTPQGDDITLATVTFDQGTNIKFVSQVNFIEKSAWPNNDESIYPWGAIVTKGYPDGYTDEHTNEKWVCIREAQGGTKGLLVSISKFKRNNICGDNLAPESQAKEISKILKTDWDGYVLLFKSANSNLEKGEWYWYGRDKLSETVLYAIKLSENECDWKHKFAIHKYHFLFCETFGTRR